jgi:ABC-type lipoprotein release transport system permease subunit
MRTAGDPMRVLPAVKTAIWSVDPNQRLTSNIVTLEGHMEPNDVVIFVAALTTLALAGLLASAVPARPAASVDPLVALRHE